MTGLLCQICDEPFLGIHVQLGTESATDFGRDHAHAVFRDTDHQGELRSEQMWNLCGRPNDQLIVRHLQSGDGTASLHRDRCKPLIDESLFHDHVGAFECFFRVAALKTKVVRNVV